MKSILSPYEQTWIGFRKPKNMCTYNGFTGLRLQQTQAGNVDADPDDGGDDEGKMDDTNS